jgi:hypothetical protein
MPAAIPLVIQGASMVGGAIASRRAQKAAQKRSAEEQVALTGGQQAAGTLGQAGQALITGGQETQAPATNYFSTLLRGNRAQQTQAVAAPTAAVQDVYRGAERNLERSGVRGAQRDVASAELGRERASRISSLVTGVQPQAAAALTQIGQTQTSQGIGASGTAGSLYGNLLPQGAQNRMYARQEGQKAGEGWGGLVFDMLSSYAGSKGGGGKKPLASRQTAPFQGFLPTAPQSGY